MVKKTKNNEIPEESFKLTNNQLVNIEALKLIMPGYTDENNVATLIHEIEDADSEFSCLFNGIKNFINKK